MSPRIDLDQTDLGILYLLQENARKYTTEEIGEKVGVSSSTVSNRIQGLESRGVIDGYQPFVNYKRAGFDNHYVLLGTISPENRDGFVQQASSVAGVVSIREFLTTRKNTSVEIVAPSQEQIEQSITELWRCGFSIEEIRLLAREHRQPFDHFGKQFIDD